jgi:hypothetical protein
MYTIGTLDFLYPYALTSVPAYEESGYYVQTDFLEQTPHCSFDVWGRAVAFWGGVYQRKKAGLFGPARWHHQAASLGGIWYREPWFGDFAVFTDDWFYHSQHGFLYSPSRRRESIYFFDPNQGWLYTNHKIYPFLYRFSDQAWIWYQRPSQQPRWFYNFGSGGWYSLN